MAARGEDITLDIRGVERLQTTTDSIGPEAAGSVEPGSDLEATGTITDNDSQPNLSRDARTLIFTSNRSGGSGGTDLWMTTRAP